MLIDSKEMSAAQELLSLSKWGVIRLSAYPTKAIAHATAAFRANKSKKEDPIAWYFKACERWCSENNTEPALVEARKFAQEQGIPSKPEWTQARKPIDIPTPIKARRIVVKEQRKALSPEESIAERVKFVEANKDKAHLDANVRALCEGFSREIESFRRSQLSGSNVE